MIYDVILLDGGGLVQMERVGDGVMRVQSESNADASYEVKLVPLWGATGDVQFRVWVCECQGFLRWHRCKHVDAVRGALD